MRYIGGIDPGLTGALTVLDFEEYRLHVWDTPTVDVVVSGKPRKRCDVPGFADALALFPIDDLLIENVHSTPNDGHVGAFQFGKVTGIAIGLVTGLNIPLAQVSPAKWKLQLRVDADKKAAVHRASDLFPNCTAAWGRAMDHGRAESALIALYHAIDLGLLPKQAFTLGLINGQPPKPKNSRKK